MATKESLSKKVKRKYIVPDDVVGFREGVRKILEKFLKALEVIAYDKYEITAGDLISFKEQYNKKLEKRAAGIIADYDKANDTARQEYERLVRSYYRVPTNVQRKELRGQMVLLKKRFDRLLKILKAKAIVAIEDIEDSQLAFSNLERLKQISKMTLTQIEKSWATEE